MVVSTPNTVDPRLRLGLPFHALSQCETCLLHTVWSERFTNLDGDTELGCPPISRMALLA